MSTTPTRQHAGELSLTAVHTFRALGQGEAIECRYRVYRRADGFVVVFSDSTECALSIPLAHIEQLASELLPALVPEPGQRDRVTWLVHVPSKWAAGEVPIPEMFAHVAFEQFYDAEDAGMGKVVRMNLPSCAYGWFSRPEWSRLTRAQLESIIGMEWNA